MTKDSNPALFGILSKSLQRISKNELQDILSRDATIAEPLSPQMLLRHYPTQTTIAIGLFAILLSLLIFMSITSSQRRQQNLRLGEPEVHATFDAAARGRIAQRSGRPLGTSDRLGLKQRRPQCRPAC